MRQCPGYNLEAKAMLEVTDRIRIPFSELQWSFVRSGGPGGQNVNKVASKAVMRWHAVSSTSLPDDIKRRFLNQQRHRLTKDGELLITSQRYRDQERNRQDCLDKLREMIHRAIFVPRPRRPTKPSRASKESRLRTKKLRARAKMSRRRPLEE
jgi:ribosome-associated protein